MPVEKSVVVQGKSVDEALQRAALLLHASTVNLAYEILQQGLVDQKGGVRMPYKLRVLQVVGPPPPREDSDWPDDVFAPPFSKAELASLSSHDFFEALQTAIAGQPESGITAPSPKVQEREPPLYLRGGLSMALGSVKHNGDVHVSGNVRKGVTITAAGSILVSGDIEEALVDAEEDITIEGGLLGTARSTHGSISCLFAQGAYVESAKHITILESSLHSTLISDNLIDVGNTILGGSCNAAQLIYAKTTGSESGVITRLSVGMNSRLRNEAEGIRRQASKLVVKLSEVSSVIKELEPSETTGMPTSIEDRLRLWNAMSEKARINDRLVALSRRKNVLVASIDRDRSGRIKIADKVHPQTVIEIDDVAMTIKKLTQFVTFSKDYEASAMRMTSFR